MNNTIDFPSQSEYPAYAEMYMKFLDKEGGLLQQLGQNLQLTKELVASLSDEELNSRYAEDKWTIKEVLVHIIDDERIYAYRALAFARNDKTNLPGFEQNDYTKYSDAHNRDIDNIMAEYEVVRRSTISLFNGFSKDALLRIGMANGNNTSVRALGYHIAGHELHHINLIRERYLTGRTQP